MWSSSNRNNKYNLSNKIKDMNKCNECNSELVWGGDHTYEDYGLEGEGIVSNYTCSNESCPIEMILVYSKL